VSTYRTDSLSIAGDTPIADVGRAGGCSLIYSESYAVNVSVLESFALSCDRATAAAELCDTPKK